MLDRDDTTGGKTLTVTNPIHFVEDRRLGIARSQKVTLERVGVATNNGATGGHQRLAHHLPAEHPLRAFLGAAAPKQVDFDSFEVEQLDQ